MQSVSGEAGSAMVRSSRESIEVGDEGSRMFCKHGEGHAGCVRGSVRRTSEDCRLREVAGICKRKKVMM